MRDLLARRELLVVLVDRELRLRVKRATIGTIWPILAPFFLMALYFFIFSRVFEAPVDRYPEFIMAGLLPWAFVSSSIGTSVSSISSESDMVRKTSFPYELLPLSATITQAINFALTTLVFLLYLGVVGRLPLGPLPLLLVPMLASLALAMGLGMIVALIDVYDRDLRKILGNLLTIWFFLIPIVYTPEMAPRFMSFLRFLDPMHLIVLTTRQILYEGAVPRLSQIGMMLVLCGGIFVLSHGLFTRFSSALPKDV